ncbi:hypothetical protein [Nocardia blacklockiae]|uniref:hypothetical protein n=1 Tax=Nocardia blacklockiae TaxID=480036 RepID=UPI0018944766|nr:hypothetical protein [Nocardia blacklockiae]MBF6174825.1 hypothetical protein [Nocardia blacklockiae]
MALGDDDVNRGDGVAPGQGAFAPSENTVRLTPSPGQANPSPGQATEAAPATATRRSGFRRRPLGRPRWSTLLLLSVWVAVLVLYLQVRPGG